MREPAGLADRLRSAGFSDVEISLVVPMFNEEDAVGLFFDALLPVLRDITEDYEIICVNDGSTDRTLELLLAARETDQRVRVLDLSRNFGKEIALTAGIDFASGRAIIPIDCDLQDPPEVIRDLVAKWREGYDVVTGIRTDRSSDSLLKRLSAGWFYRVVNRMSEIKIPPHAGDFRLLDRKVAEALGRLPERTRFMKGMYAWLGFRQAQVTYARAPRAAGVSKFGYWRLWNFALDGIVSYTTSPLKVWSYLGFGCALLALAYTIFIVVRTLVYGIEVPGYASVLTVSLFFNGVTLISLGVLGEYVGRIFIEVKHRPLYLVAKSYGVERTAASDAAPQAERPTETRRSV